MDGPRTLQEAIVYFNDYANCHRFMMSVRWPDGKVTCPRCGSDHVIYLDKARVWKCYGKHDHAKFSLKTGTIFEDSPLPLDKWLTAVWTITSAKNGLSSYEIHRSIGVTHKTAWFMLQRIRLAMRQGHFGKATGHVEVDETFIGGKARNMHKHIRDRKITGTGGKDKTAVVGVLERGGRIRVSVIGSRRKNPLQSHVKEHVETGAHVFTDALKSYEGLEAEYVHQIIDHAVAYVEGQVHMNGVENFWSLLKRTLSGTYVSVEPFHLARYLDEQAFRFNERKDAHGDLGRLRRVMGNACGRRLTYQEVTGKAQLTDQQDEGK
jgi:transposase-like protein